VAGGTQTTRERIECLYLRGIPAVLNAGATAELFDTLHGDLQREVAGHVHRLIGNRTVDTLSREDVEQTVWLKVWAYLRHVTRRPGHGRHDGLRAWVHAITRNTVLDLIRIARHHRQVSIAPDGYLDYGNEVRTQCPFEALPITDPHACAVAGEVAEVLREALRIMTRNQARCLIETLRGYDSMEAGARLGHSDRGVRHAILRARRTFKAVAARRGIETCR